MESTSQGQDWSAYGIDNDGPVHPASADNVVVVPATHIPLTDEQQEHLTRTISPLADDGNHGCNLYLETLHFIRFLSEH